jgi:trans-aconitate methyltransferase
VANVRWVVASIETAELDPPYALAVAGDSVHWFEWETALPRLASALAPGAPFAIVHRNWFRDPALAERLRPVWDEHSWNVDFEPLEPVPELERRGLFERLGERTVEPDPWRPTVDELVGSQRSVSAFVREKLRDPAAFDAALRDAVADRVASDGRLDLDVDATVVWGLPRA